MVQFYGDIPTNTPTPVTPTPTNPQIKYGDLNNDNEINSIDYAYLKQYLLGMSTQNINLAAADVNLDGDINSIDFALVKKYLLGMINTLPYIN